MFVRLAQSSMRSCCTARYVHQVADIIVAGHLAAQHGYHLRGGAAVALHDLVRLNLPAGIYVYGGDGYHGVGFKVSSKIFCSVRTSLQISAHCFKVVLCAAAAAKAAAAKAE